MLNWLTRAARRTETQNFWNTLRLEILEARDVPAVLIQIDYSLDNGFFSNNPGARAVMEQVASEIGSTISSNLSAITPGGGNTWTASFFNPTTGGQTSISNMTIGGNTIKVFVGARALSGGEAGFGGTGGYGISGTQTFISSIQNRGNGGFSTWGGSIAFDTNQNWFFGSTTAGLNSSKLDFYSVASHELGHVLGIGTSQQWQSLSSGGTFHGSNAMAVYGGAVPESPDGAHWADSVTVNGQRACLDPTLTYGQRVSWSALDAAALRDLGWGAGSSPSAPAQTLALAGSASGTVQAYAATSAGLVPTGVQFTPFPGYTGEVHIATGDFNGDGVQDFAFATGPGTLSVVEVISGSDGSFLVPPTVLLPGYTGGFSIAAGDIDHDGKAELVIAVANGAPPYVAIFHASNGLELQTAFVAFDAPWFTGGLRVAVGDLNHDGYADVVVTTASILGAVGIYDGKALAQGHANYLFAPFVPLPGTPFGLNAAVGDMDGDGYGDLALTFEKGPGVVAVWSGALMTANPNTPVSQLPFMGAAFVFSPSDLSGARVLFRDLDGDGRDELIVSSANKANSAVQVFNYSQLTGGGSAPTLYPLGMNTVSGVFAADHVTQKETVVLAPTTDSPTDNTQTYTVTAAPTEHKCTCPACRGLTNLLGSAGGTPLVSAIPVA